MMETVFVITPKDLILPVIVGLVLIVFFLAWVERKLINMKKRIDKAMEDSE